MRIKYLGTAACEAFPALFCQCDACVKARELGGKNIRGRSSMLIDDNILIDFSPDIYMQSIKFGLEPWKLTDVIITHSHIDHFDPYELLLRLDGCYCHIKNGIEHINVHGNNNVGKTLKGAIQKEFNKDDVDYLKFNKITKGVPFKVEAYIFTPLPASHDFREECFIYLIEGDGGSMLYGNDTGSLLEETWEMLKGKKLDVVSLDCCFGPKQGCEVHMGLHENVECVKRLREIGCIDDNTMLISTHFSHNCGALHDDMHQLFSQYGLTVCYDGMELEIGKK